jgi:hypothetical protein
MRKQGRISCSCAFDVADMLVRTGRGPRRGGQKLWVGGGVAQTRDVIAGASYEQ